MAATCEAGCKNDKIGYDQPRRQTLYDRAKAVNFDLSKITTACDCDCGSFMGVCAIAAGINVMSDGWIPSTGSMESIYKSKGFSVLKDSKYLKSDEYLKRGDILLASGHTAMALGNGSQVAIKCTVKYDANGGSGTMANTTVMHGELVNLRKNVFTRTGHQFKGWYMYRHSDDTYRYLNPEGKKVFYKKGSQPSGSTLVLYKDEGGVQNISAVNNDIVTMYAQWTACKCTVKYDANGGSGSMANTTVTYGDVVNLRKNTFTRTGHQFIGWHMYRESDGTYRYLNPEGKKVFYKKGSQPSGSTLILYKDEGGVQNMSTKNNDTIIMYAQWKQG